MRGTSSTSLKAVWLLEDMLAFARMQSESAKAQSRSLDPVATRDYGPSRRKDGSRILTPLSEFVAENAPAAMLRVRHCGCFAHVQSTPMWEDMLGSSRLPILSMARVRRWRLGEMVIFAVFKRVVRTCDTTCVVSNTKVTSRSDNQPDLFLS